MASELRQIRGSSKPARTRLAASIGLAWLVTLLVLLAFAQASSARGEPAGVGTDAPSAVDQYLEVVPGPDGPQTPEEFSRSLGGDGGPVTREQILRQARVNAARRRADDASHTDNADVAIELTAVEAPGTIAAFKNAATGGSIGAGLGLPLLAILVLTAALAFVLRRREA